VDAVLPGRLECDRAKEPPQKNQVAFEANRPFCRRGKNKSCRVETLVRENGQEFLAKLRPFLERSEQLQRAAGVFAEVIQEQGRELSHSDCRRAGDCLIALEAAGSVTDAISSNAREWESLCQIVGAEFVKITFPDEKTG
jgi:hypothetical protein